MNKTIKEIIKVPSASHLKKIGSLLIWIFIIVVIVVLVDAKEPFLKKQVCPDTVEGNLNATLTVKYFYTPYCPYCWLEAPILDELVKEKGSWFKLERYDFRFCNEAELHRIPGVPSFVFITNETEKLMPGFMSKERLLNAVCLLTGC